MRNFLILGAVSGGYVVLAVERTPEEKEIAFISNRGLEHQGGSVSVVSGGDLTFRKQTVASAGGLFA